MKKLFISLATVLVFSMAFTACNKDDNTDSKNDKGKEQPTPQKANKSVKVTGIYISTSQGFTNLSKVALPRLTGNASAQVGIGANFVNDGDEGVTENDVIVVKTYANGNAVGNEIELPAVNIEEGKLLPLESMWPWTITAADCTGDAITVCVEVVRVNKNQLNKKFESKLKIADGK